ncbi:MULTISPECIES: hypothetical protein [unclassified Pseudomonas]|nr:MULTISPECIES: hypothetical protein [unclassified Pseudomonas]
MHRLPLWAVVQLQLAVAGWLLVLRSWRVQVRRWAVEQLQQ